MQPGPLLKTTIRVRRIPWSFMLRDMVLESLIPLSSLIVWGLHPSETASRLSILGTVLLTLAAFQFVISASLPSMPKLSFADCYSGCSFVFVFCLMVVVATLGKLYNSQDPTEYDGMGRLGAVHSMVGCAPEASSSFLAIATSPTHLLTCSPDNPTCLPQWISLCLLPSRVHHRGHPGVLPRQARE
jgi:hypothetical protein